MRDPSISYVAHNMVFEEIDFSVYELDFIQVETISELFASNNC